jgi:hypothetical protein
MLDVATAMYMMITSGGGGYIMAAAIMHVHVQP